MALIKELKGHRVASLIALTGLLCSCGGSDSGGSSITAVAPAHAYLTTSQTLTTYFINPTTGGLGATEGSPFTFPAGESSTVAADIVVQVATDPSGQFLYVLNQALGMFVFAINPNTGQLTEVAGSPFESPIGATSFAFDASGTYLYVAGESSVTAPVNTLIEAYSMAGTGAPTPLASYTVSGELSTIATANDCLYVAGFYTNSITAFSIGPSGELSDDVPGSPFATDVGPRVIAVDPSGSVLYTANDGAPTATEAAPGSISAFTIDSSTGALAPVRGNPQAIAARAGITIDPTSRFLFVTEANGVSVYTINAASGALSLVAGSPFPAGTSPGCVTVDPSNEKVYVTGSTDVAEFTLESAGTLTPLVGSPVAVGTQPGCVVVVAE